MKKIVLLVVLSLFLCVPAQAAVDGHTSAGPWTREAMVISRGLINLATLPLEIPRSFNQEKEWHTKLWPVTGLPRAFDNIFMRWASSLHDILIFPWVVPYTDDLSPLTEPMGLPEYPWEKD